MREKFSMVSSDGHTVLHGYVWTPEEGEVKAVVQLVHGMVEYIERYEELANYLTQNGYAVVGYDHLGHGSSVEREEDYGYFAKKDGHNLLVKDIRRLYTHMKKVYQTVPYFILGHSMGSFLLRRYFMIYGGEGVQGAIIMGTGKQPYFVPLFGIGVAKVIKAIKGERYRSTFIDQMAFGSYNRGIKEKRTDKDWLTRDEEQVDRYVAHQWCNFIFTVSAYEDLFHTLCSIEKRKNKKRIPKEVPVLLIAGKEDPVGNCGKGVKKLYHEYISLGVKDVALKLYEEDRHEILNELDRETVFQDILSWIEKRM